MNDCKQWPLAVQQRKVQPEAPAPQDNSKMLKPALATTDAWAYCQGAAHLLEDLSKAHGLINAWDAASKLCQEAVLRPLHLLKI